jgi:DNA-binding HxlR family transcriptional regulator
LQVWKKRILAPAGLLLPATALAQEAVMSNQQSATACRCPVTAFQRLISGKYKLRILWDLKDGPLRYGEIRSGLLRGGDGTQEIAPRVLSRELKMLTGSELISRKDFGVVPPKVEYRLTPKGRSFVPVIAAIRSWGDRHLVAGRRQHPVAAEDQRRKASSRPTPLSA